MLARWGGAVPAVAVRPDTGGARRAVTAWFGIPVGAVDRRATEAVVLLAEALLDLAAPAGLVGLGPLARRPAGCARRGRRRRPPDRRRPGVRAVRRARARDGASGRLPRLRHLRRRRKRRRGARLVPAGARVLQPLVRPPVLALGPSAMGVADAPTRWPTSSRRCAATFERHLGQGDEGIFRLPHFQLEAAERTYGVLDALGYRRRIVRRGERGPHRRAALPPGPRGVERARGGRSVGAVAPGPAGRFALLQLPLSSDPSDARRSPTGSAPTTRSAKGSVVGMAIPEAYEALLDEVVERAVVRRSLAHVFIDPPDAGYGRLAGDVRDYAGAVERWLRRCMRARRPGDPHDRRARRLVERARGGHRAADLANRGRRARAWSSTRHRRARPWRSSNPSAASGRGNAADTDWKARQSGHLEETEHDSLDPTRRRARRARARRQAPAAARQPRPRRRRRPRRGRPRAPTRRP